jgi:hypothetical protein
VYVWRLWCVRTQLISGGSGRRALAALAVLTAVFALIVPQPASAGTLTIRSAKATTPGWTTQLEVSATSGSDITAITARLRVYGATEPYTTVTDFELVSGTATDGVWRTTAPVTLELGINYVDVEAADAEGETGAKAPAGVIPNYGKTRFSEFAITPTTVDVDRDKVTYTGRLVYPDIDGVERGAGGVRVCLELNGGCVGWATADADGRFSAEVRLATRADFTNMKEGYANGSFSGSPLYAPAWKSDQVHVNVASQRTRVSIGFSTPPETVGEVAQAVGRLERQDAAGVWKGAPDQDVAIYSYDSNTRQKTYVTTARTGADGSYSVPVTVPMATQWEIDFFPVYRRADGVYADGPYLASADVTDVMYSSHRTYVTGFDAGPEPVGKGASVTAKGRVERKLVDGTRAGVPGAYVDLEFSADGKTWTQRGGAYANGNGDFTISATAGTDGYWRIHHLSLTYENRDSISGSDYVDVKYRTSIASFNAAPEPVAKGKTITVSGTLQRYVSAWGPLGGKTVYIYFRPYKATAWTYMGVATSDKYGKWHRGFTASRDGTWYAKYKGSDTYLPVTTGGDYVDVR